MRVRDFVSGGISGYRGIDWTPEGKDLFVYRISTIGNGDRFLVYGPPYHSGVALDAPEHVRRAFRAGEPIEPIIDWLIETYGDAHPWLHDLAAAAISAP